MALHTATDIARNAQRSYDGQQDARFDREAAAERATDLAISFRTDPDRLREAEELTAGTFTGAHYSEVSLALHRLHHTDPSDLMDSDLLPVLYALAKVEAAAIDAQLLELAQQQVAA